MSSEDEIENIIGRFGRYQYWILLVITIARLPTEFQINNVVFLIPKTDFTCLDEGIQNGTNYCPCKNPEFDTSAIVDSVTSEWKLICDKKNLASLSQSMMQVGIMVGSLFYGFVSDRYGRKMAVMLALICEAVFVMISGFVTELWMFLVSRLLIGTAVGGTMLCCYVMLIELSGKSYRAYMVGLCEVSYVLGYFLLPIIAYYVREWRQLQLYTSIPWLLVFACHWLIPESPRWLITVGRKEDAIKVLAHIAKKNNKPMSASTIEEKVDRIQREMATQNMQHTGSYIDLFRTKKIRLYNFVSACIWMCCSLVFFGNNQYIGRLQGNLYLNVILSAASMAPALVIVVIGTMYLKRKVCVVISFSVAAVSLLIFIFIPKDYSSVILAFAIIGQIGAYSSFVLIYLFTSEVFPTVVRNSAMGFSSMCARVGGFIAPFVVNVGIEWLSMLIFSCLAFAAASLCCLLPETRDTTLLNSIEQAEKAENETKPQDGTMSVVF